jgi:NAD(P)-dependent dehydrogenase (short-subunit alcohol dehydrogenase family)
MTENTLTSTHAQPRNALAVDQLERRVSDANFVFFGGSTGIGRAAADALAHRGASVLIVGRGKAAGEAVTARLKSKGGG